MRLEALRERFLPRGPLDLLIQFAVMAAAYTAWRYARGAVAPDDLSAAFAHGRDLVSAERSLHTFIEPDVQRWAVDTGWAGEVARWGYANVHFKGSCLALLAIYFGWRGSFGFVRNTVLAAMAISVLFYWLYPTAPPRFLEELGLDASTGVTGNDPELVKAGDPLFNPVAAVPSMHVGLATVFGVALGLLVRPLWLKIPFFAYPLFMTYIVVATGNHYWLDAFFGAVTAALAFAVAYALARLNSDWSFGRDRPAGAPGRLAPEVTAVAA